jgi:hypothetical protein
VADVFYIPRVEVPDQPDDEGETPTGTPPAGDPWDVSGV